MRSVLEMCGDEDTLIFLFCVNTPSATPHRRYGAVYRGVRHSDVVEMDSETASVSLFYRSVVRVCFKGRMLGPRPPRPLGRRRPYGIERRYSVGGHSLILAAEPRVPARR